MKEKSPNQQRGSRRVTPLSVRISASAGKICLHLTGLMVVAAILILGAVGMDHVEWMLSMHRQWGDASLYAWEMGIHLAVSAAIWTMVYLTLSAFLSEKPQPKRTIKRARGAAITETIIIMPVLLTIILGTSQLAVNNLANMLLNYGSFQAARTVWIWAPEVNPINDEAARRDVDEELVLRMARIQAAGALAPVAPGDYRGGEVVAESDEFLKMRAIFLAGQMANPPNDAGRMALEEADDLYQFVSAEDLTLWRALDSSTYQERTVRKFTSAYLAIDIELIDTPAEIGVEMVYRHKILFPMVGLIFGEHGSVAGSPGYYMPMNRTVTFPAQVAPNAELPLR